MGKPNKVETFLLVLLGVIWFLIDLGMGTIGVQMTTNISIYPVHTVTCVKYHIFNRFKYKQVLSYKLSIL